MTNSEKRSALYAEVAADAGMQGAPAEAELHPTDTESSEGPGVELEKSLGMSCLRMERSCFPSFMSHPSPVLATAVSAPKAEHAKSNLMSGADTDRF